VSFDVHPEHIYRPTKKQLRARGRTGGTASGVMQSLGARERNRQAAECELFTITHDVARETIAQLLRTGLLDRWIAGIHRRADETGYKRGYLHERRSQPQASSTAPNGYGVRKAAARDWMLDNPGEFTSAQVAAALNISVDAAAAYTYRAYVDGLLTRRVEPGSCGRMGRRFYRRKAAA
jgi:response regulator of citrate/malate metabolism